MITYQITNTVPNFQAGTILVFFRFSNGDENSNTFPLTSSYADIMSWGNDRAGIIQSSIDAQYAQAQALVDQLGVADGNISQ